MDTLSWETLYRSMQGNAPFVQPIGGSKGAQFVFEPSRDRLAYRMPISESDEVPRLAYSQIKAVRERVEERYFLTIYTEDVGSFQAFHQLATLAAEIFETSGQGAKDAIEEALQSWADLLQRRPLLAEEAQLGLRGELALLRGMINVHGKEVVTAWTAYNKEIPGRHDFRFGKYEIEVKSTRRREPIHKINGLNQLRASPGFVLYVLSIQFENSGAGKGCSLPELIHEIRTLLGEKSSERKLFDERLKLAKYRDQDAEHYDEQLLIASLPKLIFIDDLVPALSSEKLGKFIHPDALSRLLSVTYEVNFSGLGVDIQSAQFKEVVGNVELH